jgi:hypothetical protein
VVSSLRKAAPALILFITVRAVCLAVLTAWSHFADRSAHQLLAGRWDSLWYARVAEYGYGFSLRAPDGRNLSSMAFFPLFPWSEKALSEVFSVTPADAGLLISLIASVAAAWGMFAVADLVYSRKIGVILVGLWAALPVSIVQSMAYSESLFVALSAWSLYAVMTGRWILAGSLACLAGLTRPVGLAVSVALIVTAMLGPEKWRTEKWPTELPGVPGGKMRMLIGCTIAPLGAVSYILWAGQRQGSLFGYLGVQAEWGNGFDGGIAFSRFVSTGLTGTPAMTGVVLTAVAVLAIWPHWTGWKQRQPPALLVYCAIVTLLAIGSSGYFGSKPRLLLPAFPLLLPVAIALARTRRLVIGIALTIATAVAAIYGAFWLHGSGPP